MSSIGTLNDLMRRHTASVQCGEDDGKVARYIRVEMPECTINCKIRTKTEGESNANGAKLPIIIQHTGRDRTDGMNRFEILACTGTDRGENLPLSPLFPFVSSTELMESMTTSPLRHCIWAGRESNRTSLSCHTGSFVAVFADIDMSGADRMAGHRRYFVSTTHSFQASHLTLRPSVDPGYNVGSLELTSEYNPRT